MEAHSPVAMSIQDLQRSHWSNLTVAGAQLIEQASPRDTAKGLAGPSGFCTFEKRGRQGRCCGAGGAGFRLTGAHGTPRFTVSFCAWF